MNFAQIFHVLSDMNRVLIRMLTKKLLGDYICFMKLIAVIAIHYLGE